MAGNNAESKQNSKNLRQSHFQLGTDIQSFKKVPTNKSYNGNWKNPTPQKFNSHIRNRDKSVLGSQSVKNNN